MQAGHFQPPADTDYDDLFPALAYRAIFIGAAYLTLSSMALLVTLFADLVDAIGRGLYSFIIFELLLADAIVWSSLYFNTHDPSVKARVILQFCVPAIVGSLLLKAFVRRLISGAHPP